MRIIPRNTKIRIEIFKGIHLADFPIALLFLALSVFIWTSSIPYKLYYAVGVFLIGVLLLMKVGDEPNYLFFLSAFRHLSYRKYYDKSSHGKKNISNLSSFRDIADGFIDYGDYFGAAIEIPPVEFRFFSSYRRSISIDECLGNVLRSMNSNYAANLVKIERRVPYDTYIENEKNKINELRRSYECGLISEEEFQAKCEVVFDRGRDLDRLNRETRTVAPYYYLVFFDADKSRLRLQLDTAIGVLERGEMKPKRLDSKELALFLKYTNEIDFDEKELDDLEESGYAAWAMPDSVRIKKRECLINDISTYTMAINNYPLRVGDAWLAGVMSIPATKVVVKLRPMDKQKTIKNIDRSISELRGRYSHTGIDSTLMEIQEHIHSLGELLALLKSDNEVLLNTDVFVTCYDVLLTKKEGREQAVEGCNRVTITDMRQLVRRAYKETELRLTDLLYNQMEGYVGSQISGYDPLAKKMGRGIPGATAAAMFPWVYAHVQDPNGIKLGSEDGIPVFIDMFRRDSERVNSNVVIVGKSGSGKSYAAKSILVNLAADNSKVFVLDPENEYSELAANLHGKFINVGNAQQGRMNPFHIITALEDDETGNSITGSYASHLQFLEEFFRQILPDCEKEALEYLNTVTDRVYMHKGITAETNLSLLTPNDYPTFSDLYDEILREFQSTENDYLRSILRTLMNYVSKFSSGGRNGNIWNGPSTVTTDENFTVFNFQSLLALGNRTVTNAQMLLVMKYIDNEIIKNRDYNNRYGTNRKIVVVIDEAHVFIDEKYPIALDFMYQLAKRIRKYNGMQIVITQNIKDFVGSEELSRKSSAIINACQYSYIFSLAPNDMSDLCMLYEKAGGINEYEQDKIVTAPRGNAFVVLSPTSRSSFQIEVPADVARMFEQKNAASQYFNGEAGQTAWTEFLGDSREKYLESRRNVSLLPASADAVNAETSHVHFVEVTEEEYEQELASQRESEIEELFTEEPSSLDEISWNTPYYQDEVPNSTSLAQSNLQPQPVLPVQTMENGEISRMTSELRRMMDTAQRMMDSMGRFSYDAMMNDMMTRLSQNGTASNGANAPQYQPEQGSGTAVREQLQNDGAAEPTAQAYSVDSSQSADTDSTEESPSDGTMSLMEYLKQFEALEEASSPIIEDEETTDENQEEDFRLFSNENERLDVMSLIDSIADEVNMITVLDEMKSDGQNTRRVSIDELTRLINVEKERKQG